LRKGLAVRKSAGLVVLIAGLCGFAVLWQVQHGGESSFMTAGNWKNLLTWVGLFGILSLGQSIVIITSGIDLSIGSVVGLIGITLGLWLLLLRSGPPPRSRVRSSSAPTSSLPRSPLL